MTIGDDGIASRCLKGATQEHEYDSKGICARCQCYDWNKDEVRAPLKMEGRKLFHSISDELVKYRNEETLGQVWIALALLQKRHELTNKAAAFSPECDRCHEPLTTFGALYFSPPDSRGNVRKRHICVKCVPVFEALFNPG